VGALSAMLEKGTPGATYVVGGGGRVAPPTLAQRIATLVQRHAPPRKHRPPHLAQPPLALLRAGARGGTLEDDGLALLQPGSDRSPPRGEQICEQSQLEQHTGWRAAETLASGLAKTVRWYLANEAWWRPLEAARSAGPCHGLLRIA